MPRSAREKSSTAIYHVVLRGINRQRIFEDEQDHQRYLDTIKTYKETSGYTLYAYCLMSNHIHLLMQAGKEDLGNAFRRIGASYVYWYNWKYGRSGHLFQDRYRSEAVENDRYFLTALRYIHQNPLKAGIVSDPQAYPWSSYSEYTGKAALCDTGFALALFSSEPKEALALWEKFNQQISDESCLEHDAGARRSDPEAAELMRSITGLQGPGELQNMAKQQRNALIRQLRQRGLSLRQLENLTGLSVAAIRTASC